MTSTHNFSLPIFVGADDYHEFEHLQDILQRITGDTDISFEEIETDPGVVYGVDL